MCAMSFFFQKKRERETSIRDILCEHSKQNEDELKRMKRTKDEAKRTHIT